MPIFPPTRCPDCGTEGLTGRICPACRFELWEAVIHFVDPDGSEILASRSDGYGIRLSEAGAAIIRTAELPDGDREVEQCFEGRAVELIEGGVAWISFDESEILYDKDLPPATWRPEPTGEQGGDPDWKPASWFPKDIGSRLRKACAKERKAKRVRRKLSGGTFFYSAADARRYWPNELEGRN